MSDEAESVADGAELATFRRFEEDQAKLRGQRGGATMYHGAENEAAMRELTAAAVERSKRRGTSEREMANRQRALDGKDALHVLLDEAAIGRDPSPDEIRAACRGPKDYTRAKTAIMAVAELKDRGQNQLAKETARNLRGEWLHDGFYGVDAPTHDPAELAALVDRPLI